ncbi:MAG: beta-lactamase family protein [Robiginitomaculum sp.]|nr:beta-lactamase family protein [Robiginitomaculum sp.]
MARYIRKIIIKNKLLASALCIVSLVSCGNQQSQPDTWQTAIDKLARQELTHTGLPSLQIAIGHKGEIVFENAYGYANIKSKTRATLQTQYRTASISKWFTGTATLKLVEQDKINLDEPIQAYCPAYPPKPWPVTTRQLLSHTAGVRHYADFKSMRAKAKTKDERINVEAWIKHAKSGQAKRYTDVIAPLEIFKDDDLMFEPGMGWGYSSFGYRVLACVMRGAADKPYREIVRSLVFDPAAMEKTRDDDTLANIPDRATLYSLVAKGKIKLAPNRDVSENLPAGGHLSTASDLVKFAQVYDMGLLVSPNSIEIMSSLPTAKNGETLEVGYGHGVDFMGAFPGSLGHGGRQAGTTTLLILLPEKDISIAVMTNANGWGDINGFTQKILDIYNQT